LKNILLKGRYKNMNNTHDKLNIMDTEEILKKNVYDLQGQVVTANKRIVALQSKVKDLGISIGQIDFCLKGIEIYINDINDLVDRKV